MRWGRRQTAVRQDARRGGAPRGSGTMANGGHLILRGNRENHR